MKTVTYMAIDDAYEVAVKTARPSEFPDNQARIVYMKQFLREMVEAEDWTMTAGIAALLKEIDE